MPFTDTYGARELRRLIVTLEVSGHGVTHVWPGLENGSDPDKMPAGRHTLLMAKMATSGVKALWLPDTELFGHPANQPSDLKGCWAIGGFMRPYGVADSKVAFSQLFRALGGWTEGGQVPCVIEEYHAPVPWTT